MGRLRKFFIITFMVFGLLLGLYILSLRPPRYYLNLSNSEPPGLYKLTPYDGHLRIGDLVILDVPKQAKAYVYGRGWLPKGWTLIKNVGALPGERVDITDKAIRINGSYIGPVYTKDSEGKPLPSIRGMVNIPEGYFLPIATRIPNSFDGRYFGPVPTGLIKGKAVHVMAF